MEVTRLIPSFGGPIVATFWITDTVRFARLAAAAEDSLRVLDSLVNTRREHSDLFAINAAAGGEPVHVSPQTLALLGLARRAWLLSRGLYDPTSVPFADALNLREQVGRVPSSQELDSLRALGDFGTVEISQTARTVRLPRRGMKLELDAIARGAALDLARRVLRDPSIRAGLLRSGACTMVFGRPAKDQRWSVIVAPPRTGRPGIGAATLDSGVMAIASDSERTSPVADRLMRLVDRRTGQLPTGTASTVVIARTGAEAAALSAAFYMLGPERAIMAADSLRVAAIAIREPALNTPITRQDVLVSAAADPLVELIPELKTKFRLVPKPPPPKPPAR